MKYEYLCGYESDFFAMPANVIAVVRLDHCVQGLTEFSQIIECGKPVLAMRRIIKEPKRWTWEDKKAGRLPEAGADVLFGKKGKHDVKIAEFIGTGTIECVWCLKLRCGSYVFVESEIVSPIETPAEKAQREEDDFVEELASGVSRYDRFISGVSRYDSFINGARAAYRKLKGGE